MSTDSITETTALTAALLADGWTYTHPVRTEPQRRTRIHELASGDGRLNLDAAEFPDGHMTAQLSVEAVRIGPGRRPGWMAELHAVPLPVALAAITAASGNGSNPCVQDVLTAYGWTQREDITERDRVLERAWDSPDGTRTVSHLPGDRFESGYWLVGRPGPDGRHAETQISLQTPAAVITALALTDDPDQTGPSPAPAPETN
ncbi:MAG: hypothetical protein HOV83_35805 [Catenulispora sp.]|nr:hypothetical protein [Catenulispora sp.]